VLLIVALFPVFYFISPYTWLQSEPRYLTLVLPLFALLLAYAATTPVRATALLAVGLALSVGGLEELQRHHVAAFRTEGRPVPADLDPVLQTLRAHDVRYAFGSYWVSWRITFESKLHVIGAKANYDRPVARNGVLYPGDPLDDLGTGGSYYLEVNRQRRFAHVFVRGGTLEPRIAPLLRRAHYVRVVSGGFDVWLPRTR
jgi:hypothetical protein